ncbi:monosaccharide ABC transporter ATP-binding protein, CUT2 family [Quadrisphaera granulorum]|uniref:Monosaccharide ABC transporter ATP-binding protein (CUT2 family) n=1 Tax=Quadrisphaera granulorum TaxID=317664 RepID=A0A316A9V1_9ACTN|nr:sugar ABC transporter ATP-binding protein [Quadrisphaera granulorum]PWJ54179.1 monosaccharide ABC transporter ATP-binding protein (CUT2 family) [Quadrisphaera granulorum]SZE96318.1 monosaccharide ABC transporter ATP-binding protein, CUT2 family [Quadrisphaera granulorum]
MTDSNDQSGKTAAIDCRGVSKAYPGVTALTDVSLRLVPGEVHALLGENGAGKSTLVKILTGVERPDRGHVRVAGRDLHPHTPVTARRLGVRLLPQERHVAPDLSVAENVMLGGLPRTGLGLVSGRAVRSAAQQHLDTLGVDVDASYRAGDLTAAQQQLVELARVTARPARVLVLDEPTASLAGDEVEVLFGVVRRLRATGTSVLYISHHLHEVFALADQVTVLRNGSLVHQTSVADTDAETLLSHVFAADLDRGRLDRAPRAARTEPVMALRGVTAPGLSAPVNLEVHPGEVLALSGPAGSGTTAVAELLAGARRPVTGQVLLRGAPAPRTRSGAASAGIGFVPADRKRDGLLLERSISENVWLGPAATSWLHRPRRAHEGACRVLAAARASTTDSTRPVRSLSGGNQQRVVFGRWLATSCSVLVLDQPTAGVDIGAKFAIYRQLLDLTAQGMAVVVVSSDYEEISALADRVVVMTAGRTSAEVDGASTTPEELFALESPTERDLQEAL